MKRLAILTLLISGLALFTPRGNAADEHHDGHYSYHHYNSHGSYYGHDRGYSGHGYSGHGYSGHGSRDYGYSGRSSDRVYSHGYSRYDGSGHGGSDYGHGGGHRSGHSRHHGISINLFGH